MIHRFAFTFILLLSLGAFAQQPPSCNAKADDCKPRYGKNPQHYRDRDCVCMSCEVGTPHAKIVCTSDKKESMALMAKLSQQDDADWAATRGREVFEGTVAVQKSGKSQDGSVVFVADKNKKVYTITNPDEVQGREGQHIIVKAVTGKNLMRVDSVKRSEYFDSTAVDKRTPEKIPN